MLEVASDRHQALEERWAKCIWLGKARHSPEIVIATDEGIVKAWAIRRMADGQQGDGTWLASVAFAALPIPWPTFEPPIGRRVGLARVSALEDSHLRVARRSLLWRTV